MGYNRISTKADEKYTCTTEWKQRTSLWGFVISISQRIVDHIIADNTDISKTIKGSPQKQKLKVKGENLNFPPLGISSTLNCQWFSDSVTIQLCSYI